MSREIKLRRVAITGLGAICGQGKSVDEIWRNSLEGKSGISKLPENLIHPDIPVQIGGVVHNFTLSHELIAEKEQKKYDRFVHFAIHAAHEAFSDAGLLNNHPYDPSRMSTIMGVGLGGFPYIESTHKDFMEKGSRRVSPFFIPSIIANMAPGLISILFNIKGGNFAVTSACASSGHAISTAALEIMLGRHDVVLTGGCEAVISNLGYSGFANMKALSRRNDEPMRASRPFDKDRDGFVMGEGAGLLILEDYEKAKARGAKIYAEYVGSGVSSDAHHITAPHPEGEGAIQCMFNALNDAGLRPEDIGYINAHGTSTPLGDIAETKAIKNVFGNHAKNLLISSTKSMTGHLLGAAGGMESVFCVKALHEKMIPPTINLENQDPECDLNYVPLKPIAKEVEYTLNNSMGFGGTNSCLIFKKYS